MEMTTGRSIGTVSELGMGPERKSALRNQRHESNEGSYQPPNVG